MNRHSLTGQRLLALFLLGCLLLNFPVLSLFSTDGMVWGVPLLYVYIFLAWGILIALMALVIEL
ncbi:MAG: hypothetical protein R3E79_11515 [Caldilineaceae bacterium]